MRQSTMSHYVAMSQQLLLVKSMKPNYKEMLKEAKEEKWEKVQDSQIDKQECNYSEEDKCVACTHPNWCIFSNERIQYEAKETSLKNKINDLKNYLLYGEGTIGYDKMNIKVKIMKLEKELKQHQNINR